MVPDHTAAIVMQDPCTSSVNTSAIRTNDILLLEKLLRNVLCVATRMWLRYQISDIRFWAPNSTSQHNSYTRSFWSSKRTDSETESIVLKNNIVIPYAQALLDTVKLDTVTVHTARWIAITYLKFLSPSATISNMFDIIVLEKSLNCASKELSQLVYIARYFVSRSRDINQGTERLSQVIAHQCEPGFIGY